MLFLMVLFFTVVEVSTFRATCGNKIVRCGAFSIYEAFKLYFDKMLFIFSIFRHWDLFLGGEWGVRLPGKQRMPVYKGSRGVINQFFMGILKLASVNSGQKIMTIRFHKMRTRLLEMGTVFRLNNAREPPILQTILCHTSVEGKRVQQLLIVPSSFEGSDILVLKQTRLRKVIYFFFYLLEITLP